MKTQVGVHVEEIHPFGFNCPSGCDLRLLCMVSAPGTAPHNDGGRASFSMNVHRGLRDNPCEPKTARDQLTAPAIPPFIISWLFRRVFPTRNKKEPKHNIHITGTKIKTQESHLLFVVAIKHLGS